MHHLLELIKKEQNIYNIIFHELIRQVFVFYLYSCFEHCEFGKLRIHYHAYCLMDLPILCLLLYFKFHSFIYEHMYVNNVSRLIYILTSKTSCLFCVFCVVG